MLPERFPEFFNLKSVPDRTIPPDAVKVAPVSLFTELMVIVVTPAFVAWEMLVAPEATNLKSPAATVLDPVASLVTVSLSTLAIVTVDPAWDTVTLVPPVKVTSPEVKSLHLHLFYFD